MHGPRGRIQLLLHVLYQRPNRTHPTTTTDTTIIDTNSIVDAGDVISGAGGAGDGGFIVCGRFGGLAAALSCFFKRNHSRTGPGNARIAQ